MKKPLTPEKVDMLLWELWMGARLLDHIKETLLWEGYRVEIGTGGEPVAVKDGVRITSSKIDRQREQDLLERKVIK